MVQQYFNQFGCPPKMAQNNSPCPIRGNKLYFGLRNFLLKKVIFLIFLLPAGGMLFAQNDSLQIINDTLVIGTVVPPKGKEKPKPPIDTVHAQLRKTIQKSVQKNLEEFEIDKMLAKQAKFFAELTIELENTNEYLQRGIDTTNLEKEISNITKWFRVAADGVFINKGSTQTSRNLTITHIILKEAMTRLNSRFEETQHYLDELSLHKKRIDSLLTDSILLNIPKDSTALMGFYKKAVQVGTHLGNTYRTLKDVINTVQDLNARCQVVHNTLRIKLEEVEQYRKNLIGGSQVKREVSNIWGPIGVSRPLKEILAVSAKKNQIVLSFYLGNNLGKILVMALLTIILAYFLKYLEKTGVKRLAEKWNPGQREVLSQSWLISIFIMLNVGQFFFKNPPFLFYASGWILSSLILTVLFWHKLNQNLRLPWILLMTLFFITVLENSVLQASRPERWFMLLLAICILAAALFSISRLTENEGNNRFLLIFVSIVIVLESVSIFANIFGRYNMAKTLLTSGIFNLVVMVLLLWAISYINELLKIIGIVFNLNQNEEPLEINGTAKQVMAPKKGLLPFPSYLNIFLITGWFVLFMRNFYGFTVFTEPFRDFMENERTIGAYSFSIQSIFNFFLIMFSATMLSKVVSFFASDAQQGPGNGKKGLGSWLLLVRISIFSIAMFLAFAATGIAMDKIAIIFSALSVGIGFGLQTLVNNLVSGLIIAFEKPVNVGDAVDINGQSGTMKSIGFRSSVISTYDGSDIIIPNGDLLNAHLINWTLGDTKRRVEVLVGVAYGTDIERVKAILAGILEKDVRILRYPAPTILVKEFAASSIDFRVLFWIDTAYHLWSGVKSDVLEQIDIHFKQEGIEIPFAQQDINIRSIAQPGMAMETNLKKGEYEKDAEDEKNPDQDSAPVD